jgi:hypothetical protein
VSQATVAADFGKALDIHGNLAAQITLNHVLAIDEFADPRHLSICKIPHPRFGLNICARQDIIATTSPDAVDVCKAYFNLLVTWYIYTSDTCHNFLSAFLLLSPGAACDSGSRK